MKLSAVICAYNSKQEALERTLEGVRRQTLPHEEWELALVDNNSSPPLSERFSLEGMKNARIVEEKKPGLTPARLAGVRHTTAPVIVFIDDDNVLHEDYFANAVAAFEDDEKLGAAGGRNVPEYEADPPSWLSQTNINLACRDHGEKPIRISWENSKPGEREYHGANPVGAGMVIRREAFDLYAQQLESSKERQALDRTGKSLVSGGDNDIIMTVLEEGWETAYLPDLELTHLIPKGRVDPSYLYKLTRASSRSWVQVTHLHNACPWVPIPKWQLPLYRLRYFLTLKPWTSELAAIRYQAACGRAEGRALIS